MTLAEYVREFTQSKLAVDLGVSQGLVSQWVTGRTNVTAARAIQIEAVTGGAVTRAELRPDLFAPLEGAAAPAQARA